MRFDERLFRRAVISSIVGNGTNSLSKYGRKTAKRPALLVGVTTHHLRFHTAAGSGVTLPAVARVAMAWSTEHAHLYDASHRYSYHVPFLSIPTVCRITGSVLYNHRCPELGDRPFLLAQAEGVEELRVNGVFFC